MRLARFDVEVAQLNLRHRPRQPFDAREDRDVVIFVGQHQNVFARVSDGGRKRQARRFVGLQAHALAQAENRIEYRAGGVRKRTVFGHGERRARVVAAPQKTRAARFVLHRADGVAFGGNGVYGVNGRVMRRARTAACDQRIVGTDEFRFDKQVAEGRMRGIGGGRRQHDFGVTRHFDFTHARRAIGECHATHFGVVFGRNDDVGLRVNARVEPLKHGALFGERDFITLRRARGGLITG